MNAVIEGLYQDISSSTMLALQDKPWVSTEYMFRAIYRFSEQFGFFVDDGGRISKTYVTESPGDEAFGLLRTEMAKRNNGRAWYTAVFKMTPDGKFRFKFDYDHLPAFDIMPEPHNWLDEFKKHPRPELQAQIQDWLDGSIGYDRADELVKRLADLQRGA